MTNGRAAGRGAEGDPEVSGSHSCIGQMPFNEISEKKENTEGRGFRAQRRGCRHDGFAFDTLNLRCLWDIPKGRHPGSRSLNVYKEV